VVGAQAGDVADSIVLGVDLGTTYTCAVARIGLQLHPLRLGARSDMMPSVVFVDRSDHYLFGEVAEVQAVTSPDRIARHFKRRFGDDTPLRLGGHALTSVALTGLLLEHVLELASVRFGRRPDELVLTHPASFGPYRLDQLRNLASNASPGRCTLLPEPVAAALAYRVDHGVPVGSKLVTFDLGGGTLDVAVVENASSGFRVIGTPMGSDHLGGVDFDQGLFELVDERLNGAISALDAEDPRVWAALARLRSDVNRSKEMLSELGAVVIDVSSVLPGRTVELTRADLDRSVSVRLPEAVKITESAMSSAGVVASDLAGILLIGGSTKLGVVRSLLQRQIGVPLITDLDPQHAVAAGAALHSVSPPPPPRPPQPPPESAPGGRPPFVHGPADAGARHRAITRRRLLIGAGSVVAAAGAATAFVILNDSPSTPSSTPSTSVSVPPVDPTTTTPGTTGVATTPAPTGQAPVATSSTAVTSAGTSSIPPASAPAATTAEQLVLDGIATVRGDVAGQLIVQELGGGTRQKVIDLGGDVVDVDVAPDGRRLAVVRRIGGRRMLAIASMSAGVATPVDVAFDGEASDPVWNPDGSAVAFTGTPSGASADILVLTIATGSIRTVASSNSTDQFPSWSPDGTKIAFVSDRVGSSPHLFVADLTSSSVTMVDVDGADGRSSWIDDHRLAVRATFPTGAGLAVVDTAGGDARRITASGGAVDSPRKLAGRAGVLAVVNDAAGAFAELISLQDASVRRITEPGSGDNEVLPLTTIQLNSLFGGG
jgi:actin-like ATPase involved in cell morphogenesis